MDEQKGLSYRCPETSEVVEEKDYGLFSRFLFWSASKRGKITFWVALGVIVLLCLMLYTLEPSFPDAPAFFSVVRDIPFCVVVLVLLRVMLRFAAHLGRKEPEPEPEPEEYYNIVDPVTDEVVDRMSKRTNILPESKIARIFFFIITISFFLDLVCALVLFLAPDEWKEHLAIPLLSFFVLMYVSAWIYNHFGDKLEKKYRDKKP